MNPDRCRRHPADRKPFSPDPWLLAEWSRIVAAGLQPFAEAEPDSLDRPHAKRMELLDVICATAEAIGVAHVIKVCPGGRFELRPAPET